MRYFMHQGRMYFTTTEAAAKDIQISGSSEFTRQEWDNAKAEHKEAYGSLANFSTEWTSK